MKGSQILAVFAIIALTVLVIFAMKDANNEPDSLEINVEETTSDIGESIEEAGEELDPDPTFSEQVGDAIEDTGDAIEDSAQ